jgi:hypothetical protein
MNWQRKGGSRPIKMSHRIKATQTIVSIMVLIVFAVSAIAQNKPAVAAAACGPKDIQFDVERDKAAHTAAQPEAGKALVYFVQDFGRTNCWGSCGVTVKIGLDGAWVGANQDNSYFAVSAAPGEHHLCAKPQPGSLRDLVGLAHFTAEAGKTYYFRTRLFGGQNQALLDFEPIDGDQAGYLIATFPLSVSRRSKQ